ncbi:MAG TPA: hypothetical protein VEQ38_01645 [Verrucomicrobiae bacterium]|nr:hypothetical protein [Verrucomicrobiae bacterium]
MTRQMWVFAAGAQVENQYRRCSAIHLDRHGLGFFWRLLFGFLGVLLFFDQIGVE